MKWFFAFLLLAALPAGAQTQLSDIEARAQTKPVSAIRIILVGDSTTAVQSGWGGAFCAHHVTSFAACINLARGGRSSFSYRAEGSWDIALAEMKSGGFAKTYVLIQFGHNDQPGKPGRSTDLTTEFPVFLKQYVEEVRASGAIPILVTPLTRRSFSDGRLLDDLGPWARAARQVAAEMQVPVIDLYGRSQSLVRAMGPLQAMSLAQLPPSAELVAAARTGTTASANPPSLPGTTPPPPPAPFDQMAFAKQAFDYTHLGPEGAEVFARIVSDELAGAVPEIRSFLIP